MYVPRLFQRYLEAGADICSLCSCEQLMILSECWQYGDSRVTGHLREGMLPGPMGTFCCPELSLTWTRGGVSGGERRLESPEMEEGDNCPCGSSRLTLLWLWLAVDPGVGLRMIEESSS